jgi:hypothetical protein
MGIACEASHENMQLNFSFLPCLSDGPPMLDVKPSIIQTFFMAFYDRAALQSIKG